MAVLISGFVSLTLTPMLCSRYLKPPTKEHGKFYNATEKMFDTVLGFYDRTLSWVLDHRKSTLAASGLMLIATIYLFGAIPKVLPSSDTNAIFGFTEAAQGISFDSMVAHQKEIMKIIQKDPNVAVFFSTITGSNSGMCFSAFETQGRTRNGC